MGRMAVEGASASEAWDEAFEKLVSIRLAGGNTTDVGGWRARTRMREELLAQHEKLEKLAAEAEDNLIREKERERESPPTQPAA